MTDFLENLLSSMSTAFNSSPTPADGASVVDLNLNEDKTLKWRGLHNNQNPRKHPKKSADVPGKEVKSSQGHDKTSSPQVDKEKVTSGSAMADDDGTTSVESKKEDTTKEYGQKSQKKRQTEHETISRRLRRSRTEASEVDTVKHSQMEDKLPPPKRRGRSKKLIEDREKTMPTLKDEKGASEEQTETENGPVRKLRRSERNASLETKTEPEVVAIDVTNTGQDETEEHVDDTAEVIEKNTRRSIRHGSKVDNEENSFKECPALPTAEKDCIVPVVKKEDSDNQKQEELAPPLENEILERTEISLKQTINEKTPKKRGRRAKAPLQEKLAKSDLKKSPRSTIKGSSDALMSSPSTQKEKPAERVTALSSQRPLRRIKPTAKILENDELRYEFETKNIARMTACNDVSYDNESSKQKKEEKAKELQGDCTESATPADIVKKKLFPKTGNNFTVDNIYPKTMQKPCPDPEAFLNEIKAAKINLHRSPEDKKLNKKQQRKLFKQKEKHFEKLGLRRNVQNDLSDSVDSFSDNEEFVPSKKVKVGKTNVTLRVRSLKEDGVCPKDGQKTYCRRKINASQSGEEIVNVVNDNTMPDKEQIHKEPGEMICFCQKSSKFYTPYTAETSFCCALDNVEEQKVGCCNQLSGELLNLLRPSARVGYMILCDDHKKRLRAHNCCAGCGMFCTQGNFMLCPKKHFFHSNCAQKFVLNSSYDSDNTTSQNSPTLVLKCPHCGVDTPEKTSLITMKCQTLPVFFPSQKGSLTQSKPAKMSISEGQTSPAPQKRKLPQSLELERLIPESVMNVVVREGGGQINEFTTKDMFYAINNDDLERVAEILASGYDITSEMPEFLNGTCLHLVAHFGTIQMAYLLLCRDSSDQFLNMLDKELRSAAMCAITGDKLDILKLFIQCGVDLTVKGPDGMTCLHYAAKLGNVKAAEIIVECCKKSQNITKFESFLNSTDDGGWTAMVWAAENGYTEIVSLLLNNGANPNICDAENNTVLHWATLSNHLETLLVLLRAKVESNVQNINGDTPLHIACRQSSTIICLMLIANGADLMVKNKADELPYDCIPNEESQCARAVGFNMQMRTFGPTGLRNKIICSDISNGRELHPIQVIKCQKSETLELDDVLLPDFNYITKSILVQNSIQIDYRVSQMRICSCTDGCNTNQCQCSTMSVQNWYTPEGRLNGKFNYEDPAMIFECNDVCGCNKLMCKNRVVQNGIRIPLQVYECEERSKGWGARSLIPVPKGSFVAEYAGEVLTDLEADRRTDDSYFFDLGSSEHCIDANYYGNVSRFFNHSCSPNIVPVRVFFEHQDFRFPRIAFFACRDIAAKEELAFDYGEKFWAVKQKLFTCKCRTPSCRYSKSICPQPICSVTT